MAASSMPVGRVPHGVQTARAPSRSVDCGEHTAKKRQSCKQLHPRLRLPWILACHSKEHAMATPTEHRANIITQDLARAEELTRRQYKIAADIAGTAGVENPSVVTGVLSALASNFATFHGGRD